VAEFPLRGRHEFVKSTTGVRNSDDVSTTTRIYPLVQSPRHAVEKFRMQLHHLPGAAFAATRKTEKGVSVMRIKTLSPEQRARRSAAIESFTSKQPEEMQRRFMHKAPHELPYSTNSYSPDASRIRKFQDEFIAAITGESHGG
jgi:hypothetical protein